MNSGSAEGNAVLSCNSCYTFDDKSWMKKEPYIIVVIS